MGSVILGALSLLVFSPAAEALEDCSDFQSAFRIALERASRKSCGSIKEEDLESLKALDLSNHQLRRFRREERKIFESLTELVSLDLSDNEFYSLPSEIKRLRSLEKLDISGNQLHYLPPKIKHLRSLEELDISGNPIRQLDMYLLKRLRKFERLHYGGDMRLPVSMDNSSMLGGIAMVIAPDDGYHTGTGRYFIDGIVVMAWDNYAYLHAPRRHLALPECAGRDEDDECGAIARSWEEALKKGNRLLVFAGGEITPHKRGPLFDDIDLAKAWGSKEFDWMERPERRIIRSVHILTGKAESSAAGDAAPSSAASSPADCEGADGFPFSSYKECHWRSGIEKCFPADAGGPELCERKLKNGRVVVWRAGALCPVPFVCPGNWNKEWHWSGGSPKPAIEVIDNYFDN